MSGSQQRLNPVATFPVRSRPTYRCISGNPACGADARLYPGGAYCDPHSPNPAIREAARQPDTVAGPGLEVRAA